MDRITRQIANAKQNKIEIVKSKPTVNSLREGQEVMYITRDNKLARYRKEQNRLWVSYMDLDSNRDLSISGNINLSRKLITNNYPAFRVHINDAQSFSNGGYNTVEFEDKNKDNVANQYDNGSNIDYTNHYFLVPYDGIYHFNTSLMFEDAFSEQVDAGEIILQILYVNADGSGGFSLSDDEEIIRVWNSFNANLLDDKYWTINMSAECKLSAGNKVQWTVNNAVGVDIEPYNSSVNDTKYNMFTGHLVCAL